MKDRYDIRCKQFSPVHGPLDTLFNLKVVLNKNLILYCYAKLNELIQANQVSLSFEVSIPALVTTVEQNTVIAAIGSVSSDNHVVQFKAQVVVTINDNTKVVIPFKYVFSKDSASIMDWDERDVSTVTLDETEQLHLAAGEGNSSVVGRLTFAHPEYSHQVDKYNRVPSDFAAAFKHETLFNYLQQILHSTNTIFSSYMECTKNFSCLELANKLLLWQTKLECCFAQIDACSTQFVDAPLSIQSISTKVFQMIKAKKQTINVVGTELAIGWICYILGGAIQADGKIILPVQLAFANVDMYFVHEYNQQKWTDRGDLTLYIPNANSKVIDHV